MYSFINRKEIRERCKKPKVCTAGFLVKDGNRLDDRHMCELCRNGPVGSPRRLPVITLKNGKSYFVDKRLRQLRNVHNPHDYIDY